MNSNKNNQYHTKNKNSAAATALSTLFNVICSTRSIQVV